MGFHPFGSLSVTCRGLPVKMHLVPTGSGNEGLSIAQVLMSKALNPQTRIDDLKLFNLSGCKVIPALPASTVYRRSCEPKEAAEKMLSRLVGFERSEGTVYNTRRYICLKSLYKSVSLKRCLDTVCSSSRLYPDAIFPFSLVINVKYLN